jgi:hypothetical protein
MAAAVLNTAGALSRPPVDNHEWFRYSTATTHPVFYRDDTCVWSHVDGASAPLLVAAFQLPSRLCCVRAATCGLKMPGPTLSSSLDTTPPPSCESQEQNIISADEFSLDNIGREPPDRARNQPGERSHASGVIPMTRIPWPQELTRMSRWSRRFRFRVTSKLCPLTVHTLHCGISSLPAHDTQASPITLAQTD